MENKNIPSKIEEVKKGCGTLMSIGQGNLSPNKTRELTIGIRCGDKYKKDKFHKNKGYTGKIIYCDKCQARLQALEEAQANFIKLLDERITLIEQVIYEDLTDKVEIILAKSKIKELRNIKAKLTGGKDEKRS